MIATGKYNDLVISRQASVGLYLEDDSGEDVLLPNKYCTEEMKPGDSLRVFVYRDSEDRKIATTLTPKILLHEFALLKVTAVSEVGAFLDWGLEKELMAPFREQRQKMESGRWYVVYLDIDLKTDRLYASNRVDRFLQNHDLSLQEGEAVSLLILQKTDLGYSVIINHKYKGLIFDNEVFKELYIGERLKGFVKRIREDSKIDISLHPMGYRKFNDANMASIVQKLIDNDGFLPLTDRSTPQEIYARLGISKKAFKKSIGALYKARKISLLPDGITLSGQP